MQPNKKLEDLLNSEADSALIGKLCRSGIISSRDYLKAVCFCRNDSFWGNEATKALRFAGVFFSALAILLFCVDFWKYAYTSIGFYVVFSLFSGVCVKSVVQGSLSLPESVFGVFLIALLVVMPELRFGTGVPLYQSADSIAIFTALFAVASRSFFLFPFVALAVNFSFVSKAVTMYLPAGVWTWEIFLISIFLLNVLFLLGCEFVARRKKTKNTFYLRPVLFACAVSVFFIPLIHTVLNRESLCLFPYFIVLSPAFLIVALFFYTAVCPDLFVKRLSVAALCVWSELCFLLMYRFSSPTALICFSFFAFFSVVAVFKTTAFFETLRRPK